MNCSFDWLSMIESEHGALIAMARLAVQERKDADAEDSIIDAMAKIAAEERDNK